MTFDPTKNTTPHGLLTEEERKAIESAEHGWEVFNQNTGWKPVRHPAFANPRIYRAKHDRTAEDKE